MSYFEYRLLNKFPICVGPQGERQEKPVFN